MTAEPPLPPRFERHARLALTFLIPLLLVYAWTNRFIEDDAFISFRYARSLVDGHGLVWNPGERVEGYSNFLWTLMMVPAVAAGWDVALFAQVLGIICFAGSLALMWRAGRCVVPTPGAALTGVFLLGSNYTFNAFATSGLETQLQAMLLLVMVVFLLELMYGGRWSRRRAMLASVAGGAAFLTRMDSALIIAPLLGFSTLLVWRAGSPGRRRVRSLLALLLPAALLCGGWLAWKLAWYGDLLPNTYYSKIASPTSPSRGGYYIASFATAYMIAPFLIPAAITLPRLLRGGSRGWLVFPVIIILWCAYILVTGGDHMEYRFFVPVLPLIMLGITWLLWQTIRAWWLRAAGVGLLLAAGIYHQATFAEKADPGIGIAPLWQYDGTVTKENADWKNAGLALRRAFEGHPDVTIAVTAAGALPYYSGLRTVDMLGINDPWVARYGVATGTTPGHQRISPMSYLVRKNVNLVVAHPVIIPNGAPLSRIPVAPMDSIVSIRDGTFLLIPVDSSRKLVVLALLPHPAVDAAVSREHWEVVRARIR